MNTKLAGWSGAVLLLLGWVGVFSTATPGIIALVPLLFGNALVLLAVGDGNERFRLAALHLVVGVAALGFFGALGSMAALIGLVLGGEGAHLLVGVHALLAVLCVAVLREGVRAISDERRARRGRMPNT